MANRNTVHLSEDQIGDLREVFDTVDDDGNGRISLAELGFALETVGIKVPGWELRQIMATFDTSGDGSMDMNEFKALYMSEKAKRDIGVSFKKVVQTRKDVNTLGGTSHASVEGTTHTVKKAETAAFSQWVNSNLNDDVDCKPLLPVNSENNELFEKCKNGIILCKLINKSAPGTIDERTINKTNLSVYRRHENLTLAINSAQSIGCSVVNIGPDDLDMGKPHLVLGLLWQIIRIGLLSDINLAHHPGLVHLLQEDETLEDLQKLSPEQILLRWVNYHLANAGCMRRINNFSEDIKDSEAYTYLLHQISPKDAGVDLSPLGASEGLERAEAMLQQAQKIDCRSFVGPADVVDGNAKLNLAFVANLFNNYPALEGVDSDMQLEIVEETREEKTYRNWMNSMGVSPYVHYIYNDLTDGLIIFQLFDICKPGIVEWNRVHKKFNKLKIKYEKIENCNYACELGHKLEFSLVGVGGSDIHDGNQTLTLALVWQLMRAYTISILTGLSANSKNAEKLILQWANERLDKSARFSGFGDQNLSDSIILIKLIEKIKPSAVDWKVVSDAQSEEDKLANARYAIGIARKMGAKVYALPEDIVEVKPKMVMTIFACLMARDHSQNGQQLTEGQQ
ncbi:plastin-1 [Aplysia californica]|uniref:Plastin-1 n=1 Tax=Aplysia californica TaxID=6500 RepID=A0ABM0JP29_APLCA|nr:plastin-1 [Aplysia californica]